MSLKRDEGGGICVHDAEKYRNEILSQLSNTRFYQKVNYDPTTSVQLEILSYLEDTKKRGWIIFCKHPIRPVIYTLPKVHKSLTDTHGHKKTKEVFCHMCHATLNPLHCHQILF